MRGYFGHLLERVNNKYSQLKGRVAAIGSDQIRAVLSVIANELEVLADRIDKLEMEVKRG